MNSGLLRTELRRSIGLLLLPVVTAALGWLVWDSLLKGVWIWRDISLAVQDTLALAGPLSAGIAAWAAGRDRRHGTEELLAITPRPATARTFASWASVTAWLCLAYLLTAAFFLLLTYLNATWGSPAPSPVLVGLLGIATHSALGCAVGYYLRSRFTAPLVAVVFYWMQAIPVVFFGYDTALPYLVPATGTPYSDVFYEPGPAVVAPQSLWLLGLIGVALVFVALKD